MNNDEDLLDIIARQRLNLYHQERRIESLERSLSQATQPTMNPNDLVNQLFNQLQTSNELMALKAKCERMTEENAFLKLEVERLKNNAAYLDKKLDEELDKGGQS
jgi:cell division protein FtsB